MTLEYSIEGTTFASFGITVSGSLGVLDMPKAKDTLTVDIPGKSGVRAFDTKPAYQAREIILECWIKAATADLFNENVLAFKTLLASAGTKQLVISGFAKPLVYMVQCNEGFVIRKKWAQGVVRGTFELKLMDLFPVKRVLKYDVLSAPDTLTIQDLHPTDNYWKIYWGDGTATVDLPAGLLDSIEHEYTSTGVKYIVIPDGATEGASINYGGAEVVWSLQI